MARTVTSRLFVAHHSGSCHFQSSIRTPAESLFIDTACFFSDPPCQSHVNTVMTIKTRLSSCLTVYAENEYMGSRRLRHRPNGLISRKETKNVVNI
jgi:hypothetical protein